MPSPFRALLGVLAMLAAFAACAGVPGSPVSVLGSSRGHPTNATFVVGHRKPITNAEWITTRFPDEHTSFIKYPDGTFRVWSGVASGYTYVYTTPDLAQFAQPTTEPVFGRSAGDDSSFDVSYAGAGQVVLDPRNSKELYMLYEGDTSCYGKPPTCGGSNFYWATVGIAHAQDPNQTGYPNDWTGFSHDENSAHRTAALVSPIAMPSMLPPAGYYGDGIPSGLVDPLDPSRAYLYAFYEYHPYPQPNSDSSKIEAARDSFADLRHGAPAFLKFRNGSFSSAFNQPGDSVVPVDAAGNCVSQERPSVSYNTVLAQYLMILVCTPNGGVPQWYYTSTASIGAQSWATPIPLATFPGGHAWYPSLVSPDQQDGSTTDGSGYIFFQWGSYAPYEMTFSITPSASTLGSLFGPAVTTDRMRAVLNGGSAPLQR